MTCRRSIRISVSRRGERGRERSAVIQIVGWGKRRLPEVGPRTKQRVPRANSRTPGWSRVLLSRSCLGCSSADWSHDPFKRAGAGVERTTNKDGTSKVPWCNEKPRQARLLGHVPNRGTVLACGGRHDFFTSSLFYEVRSIRSVKYGVFFNNQHYNLFSQ